MTIFRRDLLRAIGAALAGASVGVGAASVAEAAGPPTLVLRDIRGCDQMPPGGSYATDEGLAVCVRHAVLEPKLDQPTALEIAKSLRRLGATHEANLETFKRFLLEAWELRGGQ